MNAAAVAKDQCCYQVLLKKPSREYAAQVLAALKEIADPWTTNYIWQNEPFSIELVGDSLKGSFHFGDCIEDEWFVVWILRTLSQRFDDLYVTVTDTDGEFLLIESAMHLPRWLDPDTAGNRAWIAQGELVIIPAAADAIKEKRCPPLSSADALAHLRADKPLLRLPDVQIDAFSRIAKYPEQSKREMHRVLCRLPRRLATVLHHKPQLAAKVCTTLFEKGPEEEKALSSMTVDPDKVECVVKLTRTLYAQIKGLRFTQPEAYQAIASKQSSESLDTGCRLACGFALALQADSAFRRESNAATERGLLSDDKLASLPREVDSDAYLTVNYEELEKALADDAGLDDDGGDQDGEAALRQMFQQMQKFMKDDMSGLEGAEMEDGESEVDYSTDDSDQFGAWPEDDDAMGDDFENGQDFMSFLRSSVANKDALAAMQFATQRQQESAAEHEDLIDSEEENIPDMKTYMAEMDAELKAAGARQTNAKGKGKAPAAPDDADEDEHDSLDEFACGPKVA